MCSQKCGARGSQDPSVNHRWPAPRTLLATKTISRLERTLTHTVVLFVHGESLSYFIFLLPYSHSTFTSVLIAIFSCRATLNQLGIASVDRQWIDRLHIFVPVELAGQQAGVYHVL